MTTQTDNTANQPVQEIHDAIIAAGYRQIRYQRVKLRHGQYLRRHRYQNGALEFSYTPHDKGGGTCRGSIGGKLVFAGSYSSVRDILASLRDLAGRYKEQQERAYWEARGVITTTKRAAV